MLKRTVMLLLIPLLILTSVTGRTFAKRDNGVRLVPWDKAERIFARYEKFTVVDVETGKKFRVQRRAGSRHADVQPLTSKDTAIMKKIYNGKWSWRRRAIYAMDGKKKIAASMNGMPHGAGALKNNFPGHFCIHFYKSSTHSKRVMDISHKMMIFKAAGKLDVLTENADVYETAVYFITGFKEQDNALISHFSLKPVSWKPFLRKVDSAKIIRMPLLPTEDMKDDLIAIVPADIEWHIKGNGRKVSKTEIRLFRASPYDPWKIDSRAFLKENKFVFKKRNTQA